MENREHNQAVKADAGKLRPTLVPTQIIRDIAIVREYGNNKYGSSENWKEVEIERYRDALCRHLLAYLDDPKSVDEESGIEHYKHMACNMAFLCAMEANEFSTEIVGECETCKHIDTQPYEEPCKTCNHHEGKWNRYEPQTERSE